MSFYSQQICAGTLYLSFSIVNFPYHESSLPLPQPLYLISVISVCHGLLSSNSLAFIFYLENILFSFQIHLIICAMNYQLKQCHLFLSEISTFNAYKISSLHQGFSVFHPCVFTSLRPLRGCEPKADERS